MTTCAPSVDRSFQALFRPLVKTAWDRHCKLFAATVKPDDKIAHEAWYRATLLDILKSSDTTKDLTAGQKKQVLDRFAFLARGCDAPSVPAAQPSAKPALIPVNGWTDNQVARFNELAPRAWKADQARRKDATEAFEPWVRAEFHRVLKGPPEGMPAPYGLRGWSRVKDFDEIMEHFGVIAQDPFWMHRTSECSERRMRHQLDRFLVDLAWIEFRHSVDWNYVRSIYKQSGLLPADIQDCPAKTLQLVLGMLDTRIRKLCKDACLRPCLLPTRRPQGDTKESLLLAEKWDFFHADQKRWPNRHLVDPAAAVCSLCGCVEENDVCLGCGANNAGMPF